MGLNHEDTKTRSKYKAYPNYKDSGIEWLGEVPENWAVMQIKRLSPVKRGASPRPIEDPKYFDDEGEFSWVRIADVSSSKNGLLTETTQRLSKLGASLSVKIYPNELFISIAGTVGKPCISKIKACIHDGFVYFPKINIPSEFLFKIFESGLCYQGLGKMGTQLNLNTETVGGIHLALPPKEELDYLLNFLDQETGKMDLLIEKQQTMIALLKEKRQSVISHAVTKGLNPNTPLKDSGIKWLGQIPEDWELKELKYLARVNNGKDQKEVLDDLGEFPVYGSGGIFGYANQYLFDGISVLLGRKGTIDKPLLVNGKFWTVDTMYWTKLKSNTCPQWFYYCCLTIPFKFYQYGSALPSMTQEALHNHKFAVPKLQEQKEIVFYLDKQTQKIDSLIEKSQQAIALLKERKTALISAAVTGKIDVRGASDE